MALSMRNWGITRTKGSYARYLSLERFAFVDVLADAVHHSVSLRAQALISAGPVDASLTRLTLVGSRGTLVYVYKAFET